MLFVLSAGAQTRRTVSKKKPAASKVTKKKRTTKKKSTAKYTNSSIKGLQRQQANVQKKIKEQERLLRANRADVKKRLGSLMLLNTEISQRQKSIDNINTDLSGIEEEIKLLETQLSTLETQLNTRKENYVKSMRYIARQSQCRRYHGSVPQGIRHVKCEALRQYRNTGMRQAPLPLSEQKRGDKGS